MDGDIGGDGDPAFFGGGPWFLLFVGVGMVVGTVQAAITGQVGAAVALAVLALLLFAMSYVFFDRKRDS